MHKQEALLKNWWFEPSTGGSIAIGNVYGHPKFPDGARVHTSLILNWNPRLNIIETRHTFYKLEGRTSEPDEADEASE